jgi:sugar phosphate isomerase/epimerase
MANLSAFADEATDDFRDQLLFLKSQRVQYLEIRFVNKKNIIDLNEDELNDAKRMMDDLNIRVSAIASPIGKIRIDEPFAPHLDKFKHAIDLAVFFNAPFIRVFSYYPPVGGQIAAHRTEVLERMLKKVELLEQTNVVMVHENESAIYGSGADACVDLVTATASPKLKLAYDPGNFVSGEHLADNVETCWPRMKPYVVHVHIKDWKLTESVGSMPGTGDGQIRMLLADLAAMKYEGFLTVEPHLKSGGQFGGTTGSDLFSQAIAATRNLAIDVGLSCA